MSKNKITKDMTIFEVLQSDNRTAEIFLSFGMHCFGCPKAKGETVEQAALSHGADLDVMLERLNNI